MKLLSKYPLLLSATIFHLGLQTVPGKGWFILLRLYSPTEAWFDKIWRPGEIELVN